MLARFLELKQGAAGEIRIALEQGDLEGAQRQAHSMISAAGSIGARDLSAHAKALQDAIQSASPEAWAPHVPAFEASLSRVIEGLKAHFKQAGSRI